MPPIGARPKPRLKAERTGSAPTPDEASVNGGWYALETVAALSVWIWAADGANRHDSKLFDPTLDALAASGLLEDIETVWLDRGNDSTVICERLKEAVRHIRGTLPAICWPCYESAIANQLQDHRDAGIPVFMLPCS